VLSGDYVYETTTVEVDVDGERFVTRVSVPVRQGWRDMARLIGKRSSIAKADLEEEPGNSELLIEEGREVTVGAVRSRRNTTNPPERYTEATLLSAMEHAGRFVEDVALKKRLGGGLGTPATRADIIEKLIQNHYVEREGRFLVPTPKGRELVRLSPSELRSPELTALWEDRLASIADGKESAVDFIEDIKRNAKTLVSEVSANKARFEPKFPDGKTCPFCAAPMMRAVDEFGQVHYICQRLSCSYEEALVKKRKQGTVSTDDPAKGKKVVVRAKATSVSSAAGKRVVVVKKSTAAPAADEWETVVEVVRPSKLERRRPQAPLQRPRIPERKPVPEKFAPSDEQGTTFADLLAASEKRKRDRDKKKKR
jgi:DNA topoisomerase-3